MTAQKSTYDGEHYQVVLMNRMDGGVEGHSQGCRDLYRGSRKFTGDQSPEDFWDVHNKHEAWIGYNVDFLAEGSGAYPIDWMACTKHIPQGPEDNEETWDQPETETVEENTTTTKKESTMKADTTPSSTPNVRTYDTSDKKLHVQALEVTCPIPYCAAEVKVPCHSAKGSEVAPHTKRVQKAIRAAARAKFEASKPAKPAKGKKAQKPLSEERAQELREHPDFAREATPAAVCKPCTTSHHKKCKGTPEAPCGCPSKAHAA